MVLRLVANGASRPRKSSLVRLSPVFLPVFKTSSCSLCSSYIWWNFRRLLMSFHLVIYADFIIKWVIVFFWNYLSLTVVPMWLEFNYINLTQINMFQIRQAPGLSFLLPQQYLKYPRHVFYALSASSLLGERRGKIWLLILLLHN